MIWNSKIGLDTNATGAIGLHPQPFSSGGRRNTGRPDHCLARNSLPCNNDSFAVDLLDGMAQVDFDSELLQMQFGSIRQTRGKSAKDFSSGIDQNNSCGSRIDPAEFGP